MMIGFTIWTMTAVLFLIIGIISWRSKAEAGFFTGVKPPKMKDVTAYNHAVAKIWFVFALLFEITGIPLLFIQQNSPAAFLLVGAVVIFIIAMMTAYLKMEKKYRA